MKRLFILAVFLLGLSGLVYGAQSSGYRNIVDMGCHNSDGTCYILVDGSPVTGAAGCSSNSLRWDARSDPNGRSTLALLMMAKSQGLRVSAYVSSCYALQPIYPQIQYINIEFN
jgi:hypothetical protein